MSFEDDIKKIRKLAEHLYTKADEVYITYTGTDLGVSKPWKIRCGDREFAHETPEGAATLFLSEIEKDILSRISSAERQTSTWKQMLGNLGN